MINKFAASSVSLHRQLHIRQSRNSPTLLKLQWLLISVVSQWGCFT